MRTRAQPSRKKGNSVTETPIPLVLSWPLRRSFATRKKFADAGQEALVLFQAVRRRFSSGQKVESGGTNFFKTVVHRSPSGLRTRFYTHER